METSFENSKCEFCSKFGNKSSSTSKWFDLEMLSLDDFAVIPGVGPLAEGYLMIVTRQHIRSMAELSTEQFSILAGLKRHVRAVIEKYYGSPIIFEHGPALKSGSGGSCIDHAHFHILPLEIDLVSILKNEHSLRSINEIKSLAEYPAKKVSYLFFENQKGDMYICEAANLPSQYLRRIIAEELGISDRWDYAVFPNYELISATIEKLCPWPSDNLS